MKTPLVPRIPAHLALLSSTQGKIVSNEFLGGKSKKAHQVTLELLIYILTKGNVFLPKSRSIQQIPGVNRLFHFTVAAILKKDQSATSRGRRGLAQKMWKNISF